MLGRVTATGFIQVADADRARDFYEGVLGLTLRADAFAMIADLGDAVLRITALPDWTPGEHPAFGFVVDDVTAACRDLAGKGVAFERYAFLGDSQDADGLWTGPDGSRLAWFKDPDGNVLVLSGRA